MVQCQNGCGKALPFAELDAHDNECYLKTITCEQKCPARLPRSEMEIHMKNDCPNTTVPCLIYSCPFKAKRGASAEWDNHMLKAQAVHLNAMINLVTDQGTRLQQCEYLLNTQADIIRIQEIRIRELETLGEKVKSVEPFDSMSRSATWVLDNFQALWNQSVDIYSPEIRFDCVEKSRRYSFMLKLEFNANSHVGVMIVPRQGEQSDRLEWPIKKTITISVVSHTDKKSITAVCDDASFFEFYKAHAPPVKDNLAAWGFPKFLKEKAVMCGDYVHDNKIKFELTISR